MTATAGAARSRRFETGDRTEGSFVSVFLRHVLVLALAAAATYLAADALPAGQQPTAWFVAGAALGIVAALLGRRWLGVLLIVLGAGIGFLLHLNVRLGSGEEAMHRLSENAVLYGGALAVMVVAYVATVAVLAIVFRRRRVE